MGIARSELVLQVYIEAWLPRPRYLRDKSVNAGELDEGERQHI